MVFARPRRFVCRTAGESWLRQAALYAGIGDDVAAAAAGYRAP